MQITVHVRPESAADTASRDRRGGGALPQALSDITRRFNVTVFEQGDAADPTQERYFTIEAPDKTTAERVLAELRKAPSVESAYVKPAAELP